MWEDWTHLGPEPPDSISGRRRSLGEHEGTPPPPDVESFVGKLYITGPPVAGTNMTITSYASSELWWLSFVDAGRPEGDRFLGGCIVPATEFEDALQKAWRLGCNPGGQCKGARIPAHPVPSARWVGRLLSRIEIDEMDAELGGLPVGA